MRDYLIAAVFTSPNCSHDCVLYLVQSAIWNSRLPTMFGGGGGGGGGLVGFEGGHEQKYGLNVKTFVLWLPLFDKK